MNCFVKNVIERKGIILNKENEKMKKILIVVLSYLLISSFAFGKDKGLPSLKEEKMKAKMFISYGKSYDNTKCEEGRINEWLDKNDVIIKFITQSSYTERNAAIIIIWYREKNETNNEGGK